jgi:group I intron endonuclease
MFLYFIRNILNDKIYVGITSNRVEARWNVHKRTLNKGTHHNRHLQNAWKKYGEEVFNFEVIAECCSIDELKLCEQLLIALENSSNPEKGYNLTSGGNCNSWKDSQEGRDRLKTLASTRFRGIQKSSETKKKMSISAKRSWTIERRLSAKLSWTDARKNVVRERNTRAWTPERKAKQAELMRQYNLTKRKKSK